MSPIRRRSTALNEGRLDEARRAYETATGIGAYLAALYYDRATLDLQTGKLDSAADEAQRFVGREPARKAGWMLLSRIRFARGEMAAALAASNEARAHGGEVPNRLSRGLARFYVGDPTGALDDLRQNVAASPNDLYSVLWLDILRRRQGLASDLPEAAAPPHGPWPAPVLQLLAGRIDAAALLALAGTAEPKPGEDYVCEAVFYAGEKELLDGRIDEATAAFRKAAATCPPAFLETGAARAELARPPVSR